MTHRARFLLEFSSYLYTMTELCDRYGISRKTGYKWAHRYAESEVPDLRDRSRRPKSCSHRMSEPVETALLEFRRQHPTWGPLKLRSRLEESHPEVTWPAPSTIGDLLKRQGLVTARAPSRGGCRSPIGPLTQATAANEVWTSDFKGQFRTGDHHLCYPLTVVDAHSRFILGIVGLDSVKEVGAWPVFERLFREYGLPSVMRTDNGSPFASTSVGRLSRLAVRWLRLGIQLERIQPGHPEQNGSHERMHRTLKEETTRPPASNARLQQVEFDAFRGVFNTERPHESLGQKPPASRYQSSNRPYPGQLPEPEYPGHYEVRVVNSRGYMKWQGGEIFVSEALVGERIGMEETAERVWSVSFCQVLLARFHEGERKLYG
jgi:transposase InsO family protein